MLRNLGAVIVGIIVGMAVNMSVILLSWFIWPLPEGLHLEDTEAFVAYVDTLPTVALLLVMVAHLGQAGVGGWVAARLGGSAPVLLAMIVGAVAQLGGVMNMIELPHPPWMLIEVPLYLVVAWGAGVVEERRRDAAP